MFLTVSQLEVRYPGRDRPAVQGVTLNLAAGDIGVLIGPSGCGKTTLLRAVAGLEPVSGGEIRIDGQLVGSADFSLPPEQRRIGMVFQDYALFPHLNVGRNVAFGIHHLPKARQAERVAEVLELVGLAGSAGRFPHELSGGQQQRVALARALAPSPQLMLLDEPFSNLDVDLRERLAHEVRGILKAAGATALFVTHDQLEAFAIGDMIGVVHQGQLQQWDDAYSLYHRPATRFVADFIGHGVFVPATLAPSGAGGVVARTALGDLVDPATCPLPAQFPGGECDVLLRADDVVHDDASPVQARILRKAFRGSEFLYTLELASGHSVLAHVPSHHDHAVGEWVGIRLDMNHVVAFPRERQGTAQTAAA
ncbi:MULTISPECIES: ABC transporter ATP-binding protein [Delftia]|uniref:ABC transporter ATP-binding protein n=1 Tax=Delftia tsuruhatensis TaxID=180282 RepID=A0ABM6EE23_9BURK|nr:MULTISPECIES: ABC transporter ATP-binding protein [Delftia]KEH14028.1 ABC transporter ATP-binding protein [Delftia sp. 670]MPT06121.1 ABC transporter ATP-binding protein [Delftia sp.]AOV05957.1 ABC transporter ATP-binding protein [Delftia tsuruhatensis]MDH0775997.1 ABC transporter ATP-binding protein [Delftia tsuruhatensis]MDH1460909.1 ABC transporter ATP-binding protein [Delftia tsuruhatensis]